MWQRMIDRLDDYETQRIDLATLVRDLRGLIVEADPHDASTRFDFESYWAALDGEHELRTEAWAPPGSANDDQLARCLVDLRSWIGEVLQDEDPEHN